MTLRQSYYFVHSVNCFLIKLVKGNAMSVPEYLAISSITSVDSVHLSLHHDFLSHVHLHVRRRGYALLNFRCIFSHAVNDRNDHEVFFWNRCELRSSPQGG